MWEGENLASPTPAPAPHIPGVFPWMSPPRDFTGTTEVALGTYLSVSASLPAWAPGAQFLKLLSAHTHN